MWKSLRTVCAGLESLPRDQNALLLRLMEIVQDNGGWRFQLKLLYTAASSVLPEGTFHNAIERERPGREAPLT
jgi:hypothetical protein